MSQQSLQNIVLTQLHGSISLTIRGAAAELTEKVGVSQPQADVLVLQAVFNELDAQADLPTMLVGPVLDAIRVSIESEYYTALDAMVEET